MPAASKAMKAVPVMKAMKAKKDETAKKVVKEKPAAEEPMITIGLSSPILEVFFSLMVKTSDTIEQLRESISTMAGHRAPWRVRHGRIHMESGHTLSDYSIEEGDELTFHV